MPVIPVGLYDTIEANIVSVLVAFSAQQAAMDATKAFHVARRRMRPIDPVDLPLVHVWLDSLNHESGGPRSQKVTARFQIDLHVKGTAGASPSDEDAMARLYYLAEQVKYPLFALAQADFGLTPGTIGKHWPTYRTVVPQAAETEEAMTFGEWTLEVDYEWEGADANTTALTRLVLTEQVKPLAPTGGIDKTFA
jgi:hypothetical protein